MAEVNKLWKSDARGPYLELVVGQKKDISINWADYLPAGETLNAPVWTGTVGVTLSNPAINDKTIKIYALGVAAGEHDCSVLMTVVSGNYIEPFAFKVIVK